MGRQLVLIQPFAGSNPARAVAVIANLIEIYGGNNYGKENRGSTLEEYYGKVGL